MSREADQEAEKKPIPESTITTLKITGFLAFVILLGVAAFFWFTAPDLVAQAPVLIPAIVAIAFVDLGVFWFLVRQFRKHNASLASAGGAVQRTSR